MISNKKGPRNKIFGKFLKEKSENIKNLKQSLSIILEGRTNNSEVK